MVEQQREMSTPRHSESDMTGLWQRLSVHSDDAFTLSFSHEFKSDYFPIERKADYFLAPVALVEIRQAGRNYPERIGLSLQFSILDPHGARVLELLHSVAERWAGKPQELLIEFFGAGHTYRDLFSPLFDGRTPGRIEQGLHARVGLKSVGEVVFGKCLFAQVFALGWEWWNGDWEWEAFDCHSHWYASRFLSVCHGTGNCSPPSPCKCADYDHKVKNQCTGWRACFCG